MAIGQPQKLWSVSQLSLALNLAQTAATSAKCMKGTRLYLWLHSTENSKYHCRAHLPTLTCVVNESCSKLLYKYPVLVHFKTEILVAGKSFTWEHVASQPSNMPLSLQPVLVSKGGTLGLSVKTAASHSRHKVLKSSHALYRVTFKLGLFF